MLVRSTPYAMEQTPTRKDGMKVKNFPACGSKPVVEESHPFRVLETEGAAVAQTQIDESRSTLAN